MARLTVFVVLFTLGIPGAAVRLAAAATVGELVTAVETAANTAGLRMHNAAAADALAAAVETLRTARVLDEDIATFVRQFTSPDALAIARRRQPHYDADIKTAIDTIKLMENEFLPGIGGGTPTLEALVMELSKAERETGLKWDIETLRRLERKYGPGSAKLNGLEVLAAYALQGSPAFGVDAGGRPGPLEAVLAYAPSYISRSDEKMRLIGVAEIGLRHYIFSPGWGNSSGRWAWVKPGYASYGVAWAGASDDPLTPPWQGAARVGAFFGWGDIKAAWLLGDDRRFLVTQQFQLIPWVF